MDTTPTPSHVPLDSTFKEGIFSLYKQFVYVFATKKLRDHYENTFSSKNLLKIFQNNLRKIVSILALSLGTRLMVLSGRRTRSTRRDLIVLRFCPVALPLKEKNAMTRKNVVFANVQEKLDIQGEETAFRRLICCYSRL